MNKLGRKEQSVRLPPSDQPIPISMRIRARRRSQGLSIQELAQAAGVTPAFISLIEVGKRSASQDVMENVCKALDITHQLLVAATREDVIAWIGEPVSESDEDSGSHESFTARHIHKIEEIRRQAEKAAHTDYGSQVWHQSTRQIDSHTPEPTARSTIAHTEAEAAVGDLSFAFAWFTDVLTLKIRYPTGAMCDLLGIPFMDLHDSFLIGDPLVGRLKEILTNYPHWAFSILTTLSTVQEIWKPGSPERLQLDEFAQDTRDHYYSLQKVHLATAPGHTSGTRIALGIREHDLLAPGEVAQLVKFANPVGPPLPHNPMVPEAFYVTWQHSDPTGLRLMRYILARSSPQPLHCEAEAAAVGRNPRPSIPDTRPTKRAAPDFPSPEPDRESIPYPHPIDRLPPQNPEAEEAVLGNLLMDPEALGKIASFLRPEDFYRERNGAVYDAMLAVYGDRQPVDFLTVTDALKRSGRYEELGGLGRLTQLVGVVPTAVHVEHYARIVERTAVKRRLINAASDIAAAAHDDALDLDTMLQKAEQLLLGVSRGRASRQFEQIAQADSGSQVPDNANQKTEFSHVRISAQGQPKPPTYPDRDLLILPQDQILDVVSDRPASDPSETKRRHAPSIFDRLPEKGGLVLGELEHPSKQEPNIPGAEDLSETRAASQQQEIVPRAPRR